MQFPIEVLENKIEDIEGELSHLDEQITGCRSNMRKFEAAQASLIELQLELIRAVEQLKQTRS